MVEGGGVNFARIKTKQSIFRTSNSKILFELADRLPKPGFRSEELFAVMHAKLLGCSFHFQ